MDLSISNCGKVGVKTGDHPSKNTKTPQAKGKPEPKDRRLRRQQFIPQLLNLIFDVWMEKMLKF